MNVTKIEKLENVVPLSPNEFIIDYKIQRLTSAGENYGSLMLSIDITVASPEGTREIKTVGKMVPPNDFIQKVFNTQVTFKCEIMFYKNIIPLLKKFQKDQGVDEIVDFFPNYYGSRINLNGSDEVDSNAILLLENLKVSGFTIIDRTQGFDLETSILIIRALAHLHGVSLAIKIQNPKLFEKEIQKYLIPLPEFDSPDAKEKLIAVIDDLEDCRIYKDRTTKSIMTTHHRGKIGGGPFATLVHSDCWVNNIMVKEENGKIGKIKLVDFQCCEYGSPAKDLVFFLFSSVQNPILEQNLDYLIRYYHDNFIKVLTELKCDISKFGFETFLKELDHEATNTEFVHLIFMTFPIFAVKGSVKELSELQPEDFFLGEVTNLQKDKLRLIIKEFAKRNWM